MDTSALHEAMLYDRLSDERVQCRLCAQHCLIPEGRTGICRVRQNQVGTLYSLVYARLIAQAVDPIEKKPLFHYLPGTSSFSIATPGCNFRCSFCQNADISQRPGLLGYVDGRDTPPEAVAEAARHHDCASISYTYTEPTVFFEYTYDVARLAHAAGLGNVYVTNGYMSADAIDLLAAPDEPPLLDAANVDLKSFRDAFYRKECGARLQPVLDSLVALCRRGVWVEVTTLVIPGRNDSEEELRDVARFIVTEMGADTPWHVSRFHPTYHLLDAPPTPTATLVRAREIGLEEGLRYVYVGNVPGSEAESTFCPQCGERVIGRRGFQVTQTRLHGSACAFCGAEIAGILG